MDSNNSFKNTKELLNHLQTLKKNMNEIFRDRIYYKNFSEILMEYLYQIDDIINLINVEKTDLYKTLKPILGLSDIHFALKDTCNKILNSIMRNVKKELFEKYEDLALLKSEGGGFNQNAKKTFYSDLDMELMTLVASKANNLKSQGGENEIDDMVDNCMIKTDSKYLNYIKRIEWNMFLENKRRVKTKRLEYKDNCESEAQDIEMVNEEKKIDEKEKIYPKAQIKNGEEKNKIENLKNLNISQKNLSLPELEEELNINTKMLRSRNYSKNDVKTYYDIFKDCENVNKPLKSNKKNNKLPIGVINEDTLKIVDLK